MVDADGFLVEEMVSKPIAEILIGLRRDPVYGTTMTLGMGGVTAELLRDVATLILPVSANQIRDALLGLRLAPMLTGYRGQDQADIDALVATVEHLAQMMDTRPDIDEIEINPLMAGAAGAGVTAVDAVIWTDPDIAPEESPK